MKKKILYLGLESPKDTDDTIWIHFPLIQTEPFSPFSKEIEETFSNLSLATNIILTSKMAVSYFFSIINERGITLQKTSFISVGKITEAEIRLHIPNQNIHTAEEETTDGIIELIDSLNLTNPCFFWPHSALSSKKLIQYMDSKKFQLISCPIYTTLYRSPEREIPFHEIDGIFFSSPSTVDAFLNFYNKLPSEIILYTQGPVTEAHLKQLLNHVNQS